MPFTRAGITGGAQVEKKDDEFGFDMLTYLNPHVGYLGLPL